MVSGFQGICRSCRCSISSWNFSARCGFRSAVALPHQHTSGDMKARQADIMARGLPKKRPIAGVKHVVLIASGKGGVGKSTTAVNVATALKAEYPDKEIGLLDADVFGPSVPLMMNLDETPLLNSSNLMIPLQNYGVKCLSMGFLVEKKSPVIWRGLMVMQALDRLLRQAAWDPTDYLVVDTPPGTGDTHLSLLQNIPVSGVLLVTTPQKPALQVTLRGANMFKKLDIPIIGVIQNMSSIQCPKCKANVQLGGEAVDTMLQDLELPLLQSFPLDTKISNGSETGTPIVISSPDDPQAISYKRVARKVVAFLNSSSVPEK